MFATLPDGVKLYYNVNGKEEQIDASKNVLIFLHGGPGLVDHAFYVPFWSTLHDVVQVVFIDMRGHGKSDSHDSPESWTLEQWAKDIYDFCQALHIAKPIVAGISFGGWVALSYATQYPDHALGLILCHTEAKVDIEIRKQAYARKAELLGKNGHEIAEIVQRIYDWESGVISRELYLSYCIPLYSRQLYVSKEVPQCIQNLKIWDSFGRQQYQFDFLPFLHKIKTAVLVLTGEDDPEHPPEFAKAMAAGISNANLVIIQGAGVPAYADKREKTLRILTEKINQWISN